MINSNEQIIKHAQSKKSILSRDVTAMSVMTKLVEDPTNPTGQKRNLDYSAINSLISKNTQAQTDAKNILEVNPELEMAGKILTSSIISPNDLSSAKLNWTTTEIIGDAELTEKLLTYVREFFVDEHRLDDKIEDWIYKSLFLNGSYPICTIPESSLDSIINGPNNNPRSFSFENAQKELDKLFQRNESRLKEVLATKDNAVAALESDFSILQSDKKEKSFGKINITCDINKLKVGMFNQLHNRNKVNSNILGSMESDSNISYGIENDKEEKISRQQLSSMFYARRSHGQSQYVKIKTGAETKRGNIGHPLTMHLPAESVVPVVNPGAPTEPLGFLVLLDENKNPVSKSRSSNYYDLMRNMNAADNSNLLSSVHSQLFGAKGDEKLKDTMTVDLLYQKFSEQLTDDMLGKLRDGLYDETVEVGDTNDFFRIMFTRTLRKANTEILYIPSELMTYISFNHNEFGIGVSLLEKNKMLASLKSVIKFSNAMANINNAVPRREYQIELDATDEQPEKTMEQIMTNIALGLSNSFPFAHTNPMSIVNTMLMSAMQFSVTGHPEYNDTKVTSNEVRIDKQLVDRDYEDAVSNDLIQGLRVIPELVNSSSSIDFAIEAGNRNLMYSKTVKGYQKVANEFITDYATKYTLNSGKLMSDLLTIISKHKVRLESEIVEDYEKETDRDIDDSDNVKERKASTTMEYFLLFLERLRCELPSPEETKVSNQIQLFDTYSQAIEAAVQKTLTTERLELILGDEGREYGEAIREMVSSYLLRNYMAKNNILPELTELLSVTDAETLKDIEHQYNNQSGLEKTLAEYIKSKVKKSDDSGADDSQSIY